MTPIEHMLREEIRTLRQQLQSEYQRGLADGREQGMHLVETIFDAPSYAEEALT